MEPEVQELKRALLGADIVVTTGLVLQELLQGFSGPKASAHTVERFAASAACFNRIAKTTSQQRGCGTRAEGRACRWERSTHCSHSCAYGDDVVLLTTHNDFTHRGKALPFACLDANGQERPEVAASSARRSPGETRTLRAQRVPVARTISLAVGPACNHQSVLRCLELADEVSAVLLITRHLAAQARKVFSFPRTKATA